MILSSLFQPIEAMARRAGEIIVEIYQHDFEVTRKADRSLLTEADLAANALFIRELPTVLPGVPVVSEEDPDVAFEQRTSWPWLWLVDPLDGTWQFVNRSGEFSVNVALVHEQQAVFGLILIPVSGVCYYACRGEGAYKVNGLGAQPERIRTRALTEPPVCVGGSRSAGGSLRTYLEQLGDHDYQTVGSALKSCLVAEGVADIYARFGPTSEWDTAAAQIIVEEAGGGITDTAMRPLRYNARPTLINPDFFVFGDSGHDWSQYLPSPR